MQPPRVICVGEMLIDRLSDRPGLPLEAVESWTDYPDTQTDRKSGEKPTWSVDPSGLCHRLS